MRIRVAVTITIMSTATQKLDRIMEHASRALAELDYLTCESLCLEALAEARGLKRFDFYARVLLPLQEARRQRRMIAAQGEIILGTPAQGFDTEGRLVDGWAGCVVLTHPNVLDDARVLAEQAREKNRYVEVLFADNPSEAAIWKLRSYEGPGVGCEVDAPTPGGDAAQWFLYATERLGDEALRCADESLTGEDRVGDLEARLRVFPDHELLHQRLLLAARSVD